MNLFVVSQRIAKKTGFRQEDVVQVLQAYQESIRDSLLKREPLVIPGVGRVKIILKPEKVSGHFKGGTQVIPPREAPVFEFTQDFKDAVRALPPKGRYS